MTGDLSCRLLVIGAGPGGYVCAIRAGQLGVDTVIVDVDELGGTCLNVGCIPSKALIHAADEFEKASLLAGDNPFGITAGKPGIDLDRTIDWKNGIVKRLTRGVAGLLDKSKVRRITGFAKFVDGKTVLVSSEEGERRIIAEAIVIATGSEPVALPSLPYGGNVLSSTEALDLRQLPEHLAVVGGGYIGLEIGTAMAKLGSRVTVVEATDRILPQYPADLTRPVAARLKALGITCHLNTLASALKDDTRLLVDKGGETLSIPADKTLVTVGRRPRLWGFGLERLQLDMDGPFLKIDSTCQTSMRAVFAIGDVTGEPMLAHRAMAQGEMVAEIVSGQRRVWDRQCIPAVCFTDPEVVSAGLTVDQAESQGLQTVKGAFPFKASGRAMTTGREDGMVQIVAREDNHAVIGVHAVGPGISELAGSFSLAIEMGARLEDLALTVQAHPTRGEAFQEAALSALGHPLHI